MMQHKHWSLCSLGCHLEVLAVFLSGETVFVASSPVHIGQPTSNNQQMAKKQTGLVSLAYTDSENEDDSTEGEEPADELFEDENETASVKTDIGADNQTSENAPVEPELFFEDIYGDVNISIPEFHESLYGKSVDEIQIPLPTKRKCSDDLQNRIEGFVEKVRLGSDYNKSIQKRKAMRNPSIYEKMISYCKINEMATNYPKQIYDPEPFLGELSYYEELSRLQKEEVDKRERERKETNKSDTSKRLTGQAGSANEKKTKWDSVPSTANVATNSAALAAAISKAQNLVQANKPTVISAFGTINKKK